MQYLNYSFYVPTVVLLLFSMNSKNKILIFRFFRKNFQKLEPLQFFPMQFVE